MPIQGDSRVTIALERPGASADQGIYADRIELQGVKPKFDLPDLSWEARLGRKWGYVELACIFRRIKWVDTNSDKFDLGRTVLGWGLNLSSNLRFGEKNVGRFQVVYGEGIEKYMNDAPVDVGIKHNFGDPARPIKGVPLPVVGIVAFLDHTWNEHFSTAAGYSLAQVRRSPVAPRTEQVQAVINEAYEMFKNEASGKNADYIHYLAQVDPKMFGISVVSTDNQNVSTGEIKYPSRSSRFRRYTLALAMEELGAAKIFEKIGCEPTGRPFNSPTAVVDIPTHTGNPFVNAGAIDRRLRTAAR